MKIRLIRPVVLAMILGIILPGLLVTNVLAAEVIVEKEAVERVRMVEEVVKTADNFIVLFDASGTMQNPYKDTNMKKIDVAKKIFRERNELLPDLDWNAGLYLYTPWTPFYEMQTYNKERFGAALDRLATEQPTLSFKNQPTPLGDAIKNLDPILAKLSGETAVFIFSDGQFTLSQPKIWPVPTARDLASKYDVCFYLISSAAGPKGEKLLQDIASVNTCSRVIPFDAVLDRPEYTAGALFMVKDFALVETELVSKVVGIEADNILFGFDKSDIQPEFQDELNAVGEFLQVHSEAYAVIEGFTDSTGDPTYNLLLSRRRAESVKDYLMSNFNLSEDRAVAIWYGKDLPVASNDTAEGRRLNRRVRLLIGGL